MTRNRIKLARIVDNAARKATLKKRRSGMFKKTGELSILCDVQAGTVIYSPGEAEPTVWPSVEEMKRMFERFMSKSVVERSQKMVTYESYLIQRISKETEKNNREKKKNDKREVQEIMNQIYEGNDLNELDMMRLNLLSLLTAEKLKQVEERERGGPRGKQVALPPPPPPPPPPPLAPPSPPLLPPAPAPEMMEVEGGAWALSGGEVGGSSSIPASIQELMNDQWFMETMADHMDIPGPSGIADIGLPSENVAGTSTGGNEEDLPKDLDAVFPHIYSP